MGGRGSGDGSHRFTIWTQRFRLHQHILTLANVEVVTTAAHQVALQDTWT